MTTDTVSVVVPIYDVAPYVRRCVDSLLQQTWQGIEVVLVNDGSTDESPRICDAYANLDPRVRVLHQPNAGLSAARNAGLDRVTGGYVMFVDGDDWAEPSMIEEMLAKALRERADVVVAGCFVDTHDESGNVLHTERRRLHEQTVEPRMGGALGATPEMLGLLGYAWNKLYRKRFLDEGAIRFKHGLSLVEDIDFNRSALLLARRVALMDDAFIHYIQRPRATLGSRFNPDRLALRALAIDSLGAVLSGWGATPSAVEDLVGPLRMTALVAELLAVADHDSFTMSEKAAHLRVCLDDPAGRAFVDSASPAGHRRPAERLIWELLHRRCYRSALLLAHLHRLRRPSGIPSAR